MEHRCGSRRAINVSAVVRARGGRAAKAILCEVSASGARLLVSLPLAVQSVVLIQFVIHGQERLRKRATIEAEVVRPTETGFAVEWTGFAPEAARALYAPLIETNMDTCVIAYGTPPRGAAIKDRFSSGIRSLPAEQ